MVPEWAAGDRLDRFLTERFAGISRSQWQKFIRKGQVTVDGLTVRPNWEVQPSQVIEATYSEERSTQITPQAIPLDVLYEDEWLLVINKERGMTVHPGDGDERDTLVHALLARDHPLSDGSGDNRPGIVHRLDKLTSGVMLVAKDNVTHRALQDAFQARLVEKTYFALVNGVPNPLVDRVELPLGRHPTARQKVAVVLDGRRATTNYEVLKYDDRFAWVRLRPETGRTHQLRVHMAHCGHPIVGDAVYGGVRRALQTADSRKDRELRDMITALAGGQALHAARLRFQHPQTGRELDIAAPLPAVVQAIVARLGFA